MSNAFYRVISKLLAGAKAPLASDVNQYGDMLSGNMDVGSLQFANPISTLSASGISAAAVAGAGLGVGVYLYRLTFITGNLQADETTIISGETPGSTSISVTTTGGNQKVTISGLPAIGTWPVTAIGIRIYRTAVGGADGTQKLVTSLYTNYARNTFVTSYSDTLADGSLGAAVPTVNTTGTNLVNTASPNTAALVHGLQALTTSQSSLAIPTVNGRTLSNILGKDGNCESLTPFTAGGTYPILSTTQFKSGSNSIKVNVSASGGYSYKDYTYPLDTTKQYILACWVYIESWTSGTPNIVLYDVGGFTNIRYTASANTATIGSWQLIYVKIPTSNTLVGKGFRLLIGAAGASTYVAYFDDIRLYELSATDSTAIGTTYTTDAAIDAFIPYVDGVKHVLYPALQKSGKNLLPDFTQLLSLNGNAVVTAPYSLTLNATASFQYSYTNYIPCLPNTTYTISRSGSGTMKIITYDSSNVGTTVFTDTTNLTQTFTTNASAVTLVIYYASTASGTYTFTNPQLELGSTATAFEAQNNDYLYGITDSTGQPLKLGSDVGRTVYDSMTYRDSAWWLTKRWMKDVQLLGSLAWLFGIDGTGFKTIRIASLIASQTSNYNSSLVKYNGIPLLATSGTNVNLAADRHILDNTGSLFISVADTDTGADNAYILTNNECQSFMYGWKINGYTAGTTITAEASPLVAASGTYTLLHAGLYKSVSVTKSTDNVTFVATTEGTDYTVNFSGTAVFTNNTAGGLYYKITYTYGVVANSWVSVVDGTTAPTTNTIAFVSANQAVGYTPYSLSYQLAVTTEEIVNVEGSIGLHSGGNQIEVLEGVVDREIANPYLYTGNYYINNKNFTSSELKNRANKIIAVYKNGTIDKNWTIDSDATSYGTQRAYTASANFAATAVYTVTYEVLDKYLMTSNLVSVDLTYQANIAGAVSKNVQDITDLKAIASSYTAADVLAKIKMVDGSGSGLDADTLDGLNSTDFVNLTGTQTIGGAKTFSGSLYGLNNTLDDGAGGTTFKNTMTFASATEINNFISHLGYITKRTGDFYIANQANSTELLIVTDAGNVTIVGTLTVNGSAITAKGYKGVDQGGGLDIQVDAAMDVSIFRSTSAIVFHHADSSVTIPGSLTAGAGGSFANSKTGRGYQKLPGGLIIQWGLDNFSNVGNTITFPITFPTTYLSITATPSGGATGGLSTQSPTTSNFILFGSTSASAFWIAIGY